MPKDGNAKRCGRCGQIKPAEDFSWRRRAKGQRDSLCRPCRSAYGKEHYAANRQRYIDQAAISKRKLALERTRFLLAFFESHPCVDCGEPDPVVLEFDHLRDKSFSIGQSLSRRTWQAVLEEMEKCEVVCANCHRRRTAKRRGALRAVLTAKRLSERERATGLEPATYSLEGCCATSYTTPAGRPDCSAPKRLESTDTTGSGAAW